MAGNANLSKTIKSKSSHRKTIGFIVDWTEDQYSLSILAGVMAAVKVYNLNLFCIVGGGIGSTRKYEAQRNILYDIICEHNVDGLIILSGSVGHYVGTKEIQEFCASYYPVPVVSIACALEKITSIVINNKNGMHEMVQHLIDVHKYKRFAFIGGPEGNQDAQDRYMAFTETLKENKIKLLPELIVSGNFTHDSGVLAIKELLTKGKPSFDVVVSASDDMAMGAISHLITIGKKIPRDFAVVGFDNLEKSIYPAPQLTTVNQPLHVQGSKAVQLIYDIINGKKVPEKIELPTSLVVRESCGCKSRLVQSIEFEHFTLTGKVLMQDINRYKQEIEERLNQVIQDIFPLSDGLNLRQISQRIFNSFVSLIKNPEEKEEEVDSFHVWDDIFYNVSLSSKNILACQLIVTEIHKLSLPFLHDVKIKTRAEKFWHKLRVMIGEKAMLKEKYQSQQEAEENQIMNVLREELLITMRENQIVQKLAESLPNLGYRSCFLVRFNKVKNVIDGKGRLILGYLEDMHIDLKDGGILFDLKDLIPKNFLPKDRRFTMIVETLRHYDQIGYMVFEKDDFKGRLFGSLRRMIGSAVQGALLLEEVRAKTDFLRSQSMDLRQSLQKLRRSMSGFINTMARTIEVRDPFTAGHQRRVSDLARTIAQEMGLTSEIVEAVRMAGIIHDLGKISVPIDILNKPGKLREDEFQLIKRHPQEAYDILKTVDFPWPIANIVLQHHEKMNGSGYPQGLTYKKISLEARILTVADVVEAMASFRPYRAALGIDKALEEIRKHAGDLFDPDVVAACLDLFLKKGYKL